ncbi:MAG TPA: hypothetical protein VFE71_09930, partial [Bacteroidales bacterium]|nr:hypothetical protein [Bacteroidales bacterium]
MANTPWPENADHSKYKKCWYEPLTNDGDILSGLQFTLSHPVTTLIPPGEPQLFRKALDLRNQIKPLNKEQVNIIKTKALGSDPLFKYPSLAPV